MTRATLYLCNESGASAAEYSLILALVAIGVIGGLTLLGDTINGVLGTTSNAMEGLPTIGCGVGAAIC